MESQKGGHAMAFISELGRLREQIDEECSAAFQGLHGFSQMARHEFIHARYARIGQLQSNLAQLIGHDQAMEMVISSFDKASNSCSLCIP